MVTAGYNLWASNFTVEQSISLCNGIYLFHSGLAEMALSMSILKVNRKSDFFCYWINILETITIQPCPHDNEIKFTVVTRQYTCRPQQPTAFIMEALWITLVLIPHSLALSNRSACVVALWKQTMCMLCLHEILSHLWCPHTYIHTYIHTYVHTYTGLMCPLSR